MNPFLELHRHKLDYSILVLILGLFIFAFFYVWPNTFFERTLVLVLSVLYFFWGMFHHMRSDRVTIRIVLEYFFASTLSGVILFFLTI